MTHQAPKQPFCKCCGTPIAKRTASIYFGYQADRSDGRFWIESTLRPTSREEAQRATNLELVSLEWSRDEEGKRTTIRKAGAWDGLSYQAKHFCTNRCAIAFAHALAEKGHVTQAYLDAKREEALARA